MSSALLKEMGMMESQLNRWSTTAKEALSLREKAQSLSALLNVKVCPHSSRFAALNLHVLVENNIDKVESPWIFYQVSAFKTCSHKLLNVLK